MLCNGSSYKTIIHETCFRKTLNYKINKIRCIARGCSVMNIHVKGFETGFDAPTLAIGSAAVYQKITELWIEDRILRIN